MPGLRELEVRYSAPERCFCSPKDGMRSPTFGSQPSPASGEQPSIAIGPRWKTCCPMSSSTARTHSPRRHPLATCERTWSQPSSSSPTHYTRASSARYSSPPSTGHQQIAASKQCKTPSLRLCVRRCCRSLRQPSIAARSTRHSPTKSSRHTPSGQSCIHDSSSAEESKR